MSDSPDDAQNDLLQRALAGDESDLALLFDGYRDRLRRMIRLGLDRRLYGRVDSSDVLQEAILMSASGLRNTPATRLPCRSTSGSG
jgi:hypothetical protein